MDAPWIRERELPEEEVARVRMAALLHDIGHVPYPRVCCKGHLPGSIWFESSPEMSRETGFLAYE